MKPVKDTTPLRGSMLTFVGIRPLNVKKQTSSKRSSIVCKYDTVLIGTGLSSLSTAALLHRYSPGHKTLLLEAHTAPGGAAHTFQRRCADGVITFESGPHLFSGLCKGDNNPVGQLFKALDIQPEILDYDSWGVILGDVEYITRVPGEVLLGEILTPAGRAEMRELCDALRPIGEAAKALSVACVRGDAGMLRILLPRIPRLLRHLGYAGALSKPFEGILKKHVQDELTFNMMNLLCFLLAGVGVDRIPTAEVAFMLDEWTTGRLQRPKGGAAGIVNSLVEYIVARGGEIRLNSRVESIVFENDAVSGVRLDSGEVIHCDRVVSGASCIDTARLLGREFSGEVCDSFLHLHAAVRLEDIGVDEVEANYVVVDDIHGDIERPGNVVLVSVPSVIDDTVAPPGWVVLHAYTPATEPWGEWADLAPGTPAYEEQKLRRGALLHAAVSKILGKDIRQLRDKVCLLGTPRTHSRYLFREQGSYGAKVRAGLDLGLRFGWASGGGLYCCGDGVFPGIGVPAVVGSAWIVANSCVDVGTHSEVLEIVGV